MPELRKYSLGFFDVEEDLERRAARSTGRLGVAGRFARENNAEDLIRMRESEHHLDGEKGNGDDSVIFFAPRKCEGGWIEM